MRFKIADELLPLNLLVIVLIVAVIFFPANLLRIILGIPFVLFFPGYVLMAALFPRRTEMGSIERVALSFGMSIAVVPLIGLVLNYSPWGIKLEPILYSAALFIFIISAIAWFRRRRLAEDDRFGIEFQLVQPGWSGGTLAKTLSLILVIGMIGALAMLGYLIARPKVGEAFTEFYILGPEGRAIDYPRQLAVGEEGNVVVGIINREHETVTYWIEVRIDGIRNNEVKGIVLEQDEKWQKEVSFISKAAGEGKKVEFLLYKTGEVEPSLASLHLWINVSER